MIPCLSVAAVAGVNSVLTIRYCSASSSRPVSTWAASRSTWAVPMSTV